MVRLRKTLGSIALLCTIFLVPTHAQTVATKKIGIIYPIGGDVKPPRPISTEMPKPPETIDKKSAARVSFVVAPDGSVTDVQLLKRSKTDLDDFALSVVKKWKFEPALKNGKPVAVRLESEFQSHSTR